MEIKLEEVEKKLLSEDAWIEIGDMKFRIDYPSRAHIIEQRRLRLNWQWERESGSSEHFMAYYLRSTVREVQGITIEGLPANLEFDRGLATNLVTEKSKLDLIAVLVHLEMIEPLMGMILQRLSFDEVEKKSSGQPLNLSSKEDSGELQNDLPKPESLTAGIL